jgi:hypothetical protein
MINISSCPKGFHWDEKISACVQDIQNARVKSGGHFFRNLIAFLIGMAFGFFSLWSFGLIAIIGFGILLAIMFFSEMSSVLYPVIGFIVGIVLIYWSTITGIIGHIGGLVG